MLTCKPGLVQSIIKATLKYWRAEISIVSIQNVCIGVTRKLIETIIFKLTYPKRKNIHLVWRVGV